MILTCIYIFIFYARGGMVQMTKGKKFVMRDLLILPKFLERGKQTSKITAVYSSFSSNHFNLLDFALCLNLISTRFPFSRLPRKSGKGSSVILMKAIPTGKKNGAKNGLKDSQRQYRT